MPKALEIYDIRNDEMREASQADIDNMQTAINDLAWLKGIIHRLSAPGMIRKFTPKRHRKVLEDLLMEVENAEYPAETSVP